MNDITAAVAALKEQLGDRLLHRQAIIIRTTRWWPTVTSPAIPWNWPAACPAWTRSTLSSAGLSWADPAALLAKPGQASASADPGADCMMSIWQGLARRVLEQLTATGRRVVPLAYVNTTLGLKAVVGEYGGAVCTSANAETMLRWALDQGDVLFLDKHLGLYGPKTGSCAGPAAYLRLNSHGLINPESQPWSVPCCSGPAAAHPRPAQARTGGRRARPIRAAGWWAHPECRLNSSSVATPPAPLPSDLAKRASG